MPMAVLMLGRPYIRGLIIFVSSGPLYFGAALLPRWTVKLPEIVNKIDQYKSYYLKHYKTDIFTNNLIRFSYLNKPS